VGFPSFGLRPRLLAALLLSSVVTLAVAALALLSPLEHRLRVDGESAVFAAIASTRNEFAEIPGDRPGGLPDLTRVIQTAHVLRRRAGGEVTVLDRTLAVVTPRGSAVSPLPGFRTQALRALRTGHGTHELVGDELIVADPIAIADQSHVVVVVKRLQYVASAVNVVRKAFLEAAAAGLGIALLLGIALTTTLLRRLERLRDATRELERLGLDARTPIDDGGDEIGELSRAFASMQSRLQRHEAARRAFVATASHELRTPLTSLNGMLELLEDDLNANHLDIEDARERTARAREQSGRLSHLASDLLDLSRLDARVDLRSEPVELGELCRAVAAEFELRALEHAVSISVAQPSAACWIAGDPGSVARIVRILLDNALRAAPAGSVIDVAAVAGQPCSRVTVADRGPGVPPAEREAIFERFHRGAATAGHSGFGLGLAIGRELAERMEGSLELIDGQPADRPTGACFVLSLQALRVSELQESTR
jgi:signal transduction histidine kinase